MAEIKPEHISDATVEAAAKADLDAKGLNPMTLYQSGGFPGEPPTDHIDAQGRTFYYAWRKAVPRIRITIAAALNAWPRAGAIRRQNGDICDLILPMQESSDE